MEIQSEAKDGKNIFITNQWINIVTNITAFVNMEEFNAHKEFKDIEQIFKNKRVSHVSLLLLYLTFLKRGTRCVMFVTARKFDS